MGDLRKEAIDLDLEGARKLGDPIPSPSSDSEFIETAAIQPGRARI